MNVISTSLVIALYVVKLVRELWDFFHEDRAFHRRSPSSTRGARRARSCWTMTYTVRMEKVKATIYVTKDTWERAKALGDEVPGFSASRMIDSMLVQMVPRLEELIAAAKSGDVEAMVQFMDTFSATMLGDFGSEYSALRKEMMAKARKEGST